MSKQSIMLDSLKKNQAMLSKNILDVSTGLGIEKVEVKIAENAKQNKKKQQKNIQKKV